MNRVLFALGLTSIWVLAWGSLTVANVAGGLAVAVLLWVIAPDAWPPPRWPPVRPVAVARFAARVLVLVVLSNAMIIREVLARRPRVRSGVVAVTLPDCSDGMLTLVANLIAIPPGTMALEVSQRPTVVYVHVFNLTDVEAVRRDIRHLAELALRAFGPDEAIAQLDAEPPPPGATGAPPPPGEAR